MSDDVKVMDESLARFEAYNKRHPEVYREFDKMARLIIELGIYKFSANLIYERMRWEQEILSEVYEDMPKLDGVWVPFYARLWLRSNPEHSDFFVIRSGRGHKKEDLRMIKMIFIVTVTRKDDNSFTIDSVTHEPKSRSSEDGDVMFLGDGRRA